MASIEELLEGLSKWTAKLDDPRIKKQFERFEKTLQFNFSDEPYHILMGFKDGNCELKEESVENPDITITTKTDIIMGITNQQIDPMKAFVTRKLKASGDMKSMLKVQLLMK